MSGSCNTFLFSIPCYNVLVQLSACFEIWSDGCSSTVLENGTSLEVITIDVNYVPGNASLLGKGRAACRQQRRSAHGAEPRATDGRRLSGARARTPPALQH
jgi:hypothetical protein